MTHRPALHSRFPLRLVLPALLAGAATLASAQSPTPNPTQSVTQSATSSGGAAGALKVGGSVTTSSGMVLQLLKEGKGPSPQASDMVRVHYRGTLMDGTEFDSSYKRGQPAEFPLNRVIKCWTEGVQMMKVGASVRLTCPPAIAYGDRSVGGVIPPNATLKFDVELLGIVGAK